MIQNRYNRESWGIEKVPEGAFPLPKCKDFENNTGCFVSSYYWCIKSQLIDFKTEGIFGNILDEFQPTITVSEWSVFLIFIFYSRVRDTHTHRHNFTKGGPEFSYLLYCQGRTINI